MGGFTRILHSGEPDELMDEIPTHVVEPLQDKDNKGCAVSAVMSNMSSFPSSLIVVLDACVQI
jgi:hypothetical protein